MKKKYLILFLVFIGVLIILTGCNSGTNQINEDIANSQSGNVLISVNKSSVKSTSTDGGIKALNILPQSTNLRLRIFNDLRNITHDIEIPDTELITEEITLPVGNYTIEVIAYDGSRSHEYMVHTIGKASSVIVEANNNTTVNLVLERPSYNIDTFIYDKSGNKVDITELEGGNEFYFNYTIDLKGFVLDDSNISIYTYKEGIGDYTFYFESSFPVSLNTPLVETETIFSIFAGLYLDKDSYQDNFRLFFPDPKDLNEMPYQIILTPPEV